MLHQYRAISSLLIAFKCVPKETDFEYTLRILFSDNAVPAIDSSVFHLANWICY